jgi:enoyl-CoA hydratase
MAATVRITVDGALACLRLDREHGNAINAPLVDELERAVREAGADEAVRGVLLAAAGKLFCPGLDVQELVELDRPSMERFLERFNRCVLALYGLSKPLVAAIHGHAVAGGCVLALTADWRMLRQGAVIGLNEIRVGVPFPYGVAMILRESVSRPRHEEVALFGRNLDGEAAVAAGLAHEVLPDDGFETACRSRLAELADKDPAAFAITKRYLRSVTVERIERRQAALAGEFLDAWFSPPTRARLQELARQLRSR